MTAIAAAFDASTLDVIWLSVRVAAVAVASTLVPAIATGWLLARWNHPARAIVQGAVMLPLVLAANENILEDRVHLLYLKSTLDMGQELSAEDLAWLNELAELYYVDDADLDTLVARVDVIPPSLVLAQAALESGWGTSRFAHEGNAVFGQRSWDEDDGIVPEARRSDETHVVKSFDGLKDSVLAYLVNLNRHSAYRHLRQIRTALHSENLPLDGWTLAAGLDDYAEEPDYIELVRSVIRFNKLTDFDNARLADLAL